MPVFCEILLSIVDARKSVDSESSSKGFVVLFPEVFSSVV